MRVLWAFLWAIPLLACGQQVSDTSFLPSGNWPAYPNHQGPSLYIDGGHGNFHTADHRFAPFAKLLERDGYGIMAGNDPITELLLKKIDILVISNALHPQNQQSWSLPVLPAFTASEIEAIKLWVQAGGRLLLIADHMPFPGAVSDLAAAFGFTFNNGFAMTADQRWPPAVFQLENNTLKPHVIITNETYGPAVQTVASFTGQGFQIPAEATNLLEFGSDFYSLMPDTAWRFNPDTPKVPIQGWSQGAVMEFGEGRIAVFGEAAMFTAQTAGPNNTKVGFNSPQAPHNAQFVLNVIHWLDGLIDH